MPRLQGMIYHTSLACRHGQRSRRHRCRHSMCCKWPQAAAFKGPQIRQRQQQNQKHSQTGKRVKGALKTFWQPNNSCAYKLPPRANKPENQDNKKTKKNSKKRTANKAEKQSKHETEKQRKTFNRRCRLTNMMSRMVEHRTKAADRKCIKTITVNWPVRSLHKSIIALCRSMMPTSWLRISAFIDGLHTSTRGRERERKLHPLVPSTVWDYWLHSPACRSANTDLISCCTRRKTPLMYKQLQRKNPSTKLKVNTVQAPEQKSSR